MRKSVEYADGGVGQYWVVDPQARVVEVLANAERAWETLFRLDDATTTGEVPVGDHGSVSIDLAEIIPI